MAAPNESDTSIVETLQSLLVAFVLAMTFRGFVTEGFVIPTGSMAPTLMGRHFLWRSDETGYRFAIDVKGVEEELQHRRSVVFDIHDPMLGPHYTIAKAAAAQFPRLRMGDRILVIKCLYPFREPDRFDVVVFKNPTNPTGEDENYIKRLVGLPGESVWLLDGDVFVAPAARSKRFEAYQIQRKPLHVQRAVWQPVYDSDYVPINPQRLQDQTGQPYHEPWSGDKWIIDGSRTYRCDSPNATVLRYDTSIIPIDDRMTYNMLSDTPLVRERSEFKVSDVRVSAAIVPDAPGLETTLELVTRGSRFTFTLAGDTAEMSMRPIDGAPAEIVSRTAEIDPLEPGKVCNVEFWHVDQSMRMFIDGEAVGEPLLYDWKPLERVERSFGKSYADWEYSPHQSPRADPVLRWYFSGSPVSLHRIRLDRDLYYRPGRIQNSQKNFPKLRGDAFGTSPDNLAVLSPDQYFMLGDNSPQSSDSRLWGSPHPLVSHLIDEAPFVVNRRLMLGKAWVVYFPAPYGLGDSRRGFIPDFGRLRWIR